MRENEEAGEHASRLGSILPPSPSFFSFHPPSYMINIIDEMERKGRDPSGRIIFTTPSFFFFPFSLPLHYGLSEVSATAWKKEGREKGRNALEDHFLPFFLFSLFFSTLAII